MNNRQRKKAEAEKHNAARAKRIADEKWLAQDKIDNPEKYKRKPRQSRKAQAFITTALALGASSGMGVL